MFSRRLFGPTLALVGLLSASPACSKEAADPVPSQQAPEQQQVVQEKHDDHDSHSHGSADAKLELNDGKKWETDAPLRAAVSALRSEFVQVWEPIHDGSFTPAQYEALAGRLQTHVNTIIAECKLPPDADAQLHILLVDFFGGIQTMKSGSDQIKGAGRFVGALNAYGEHFQHEGWEPLKH